MRATAWVGVALLASGCGSSSPRSSAGVPAGAVAIAGAEVVSSDAVAAVAKVRGSRRAALDALVEDALCAGEARALGLDRVPPVRWATTRALARGAASTIARSARQEGPPSADELGTVEVLHAVVVRKPGLKLSDALERAAALARAVRGATDDAAFESAARGALRGGSFGVVEKLEPFDAAGRAAGSGGYDPQFVAAAMALRSPGEQSGVVESPFGWHVIRLLARTPCPDAQLDEARVERGEAVLDARARARLTALLASRRATTRVEVGSDVDRLLLSLGEP